MFMLSGGEPALCGRILLSLWAPRANLILFLASAGVSLAKLRPALEKPDMAWPLLVTVSK